MRKIIGLLLLSALITAGCSIHRVDIQQGNLVTQEMVKRLKPGMDKRQVQLILGTPLLRDPFHLDRWDYYYSLKKKNTPFERHSLQVYFKDGRLTHTRGDAHPDESQPVASNATPPRDDE